MPITTPEPKKIRRITFDFAFINGKGMTVYMFPDHGDQWEERSDCFWFCHQQTNEIHRVFRTASLLTVTESDQMVVFITPEERKELFKKALAKKNGEADPDEA